VCNCKCFKKREIQRWKACSCNKWPILQRVRVMSQSSDGPNVTIREHRVRWRAINDRGKVYVADLTYTLCGESVLKINTGQRNRLDNSEEKDEECSYNLGGKV